MTTRQKLLIAGILSSAIYIAVDLTSSALYPGYSIVDQAVSELSAIGAPAITRRLWSFMGPIYTVLTIAFGIGVYRWAGANRALRISGGLLIAFAAIGVLWAFVPMHARGTEVTWTDTGHIVMTFVTVGFIMLFIAVGAFALGRRFRVYSLITIAVLLVAFVVTWSWADKIMTGEPTPWLGAMERVNVYGYLVWVAVFAVALMRRTLPADGGNRRALA